MPKPIRSIKRYPLKQTIDLEQQFTALKFQKFEGDLMVTFSNERKLKEALFPLLVDEKIAELITGGGNYCSFRCLDK